MANEYEGQSETDINPLITELQGRSRSLEGRGKQPQGGTTCSLVWTYFRILTTAVC